MLGNFRDDLLYVPRSTQVKLCYPIVTNGPCRSALDIKSLYIKRYINSAVHLLYRNSHLLYLLICNLTLVLQATSKLVNMTICDRCLLLQCHTMRVVYFVDIRRTTWLTSYHASLDVIITLAVMYPSPCTASSLLCCASHPLMLYVVRGKYQKV